MESLEPTPGKQAMALYYFLYYFSWRQSEACLVGSAPSRQIVSLPVCFVKREMRAGGELTVFIFKKPGVCSPKKAI